MSERLYSLAYGKYDVFWPYSIPKERKLVQDELIESRSTQRQLKCTILVIWQILRIQVWVIKITLHAIKSKTINAEHSKEVKSIFLCRDALISNRYRHHFVLIQLQDRQCNGKEWILFPFPTAKNTCPVKIHLVTYVVMIPSLVK